MELKVWVRAARKRKGLTQEALGEALGVTKGNVSAWEKGHHKPSFEQVIKISEVTEVPILREPELATTYRPPTDSEMQTFEALRHLPPEVQSKILIEAIKEHEASLAAAKKALAPLGIKVDPNTQHGQKIKLAPGRGIRGISVLSELDEEPKPHQPTGTKGKGK